MARPLSIRARLLINGALSTGIALLIAGSTAVYFSYRTAMKEFGEGVEISNSMLAANLIAPVEFDDPETASGLLASLGRDPHVRVGGVFSATGDLIAQYQPENSTAVPRMRNEGMQIDGRVLTVSSPIELQNETLGHLVIEYDLRPLFARISGQLAWLGAVLLAAMASAVLLANRLQNRVSRPIFDLIRTAERISTHDDYSVRGKKWLDDEVGTLTDSFNAMLDQIELRDEQLKKHRAELEDRVRERTLDLEKAIERAEAANRSKSAFLANMSHEIRTPMTAILGYTDLLLDPNLSERDRTESIEVIHRNGGHLMEIINDILDISKIEAGHMTVERIECDPWGILADVRDLLEPRARQKELALFLEHRGPIPRRILSDPTRLRQILLNIMGNAIKFTAIGSVRTIVEFIQVADQPTKLRFDIVDTGIGLSDEEIQRLFRPFTQADETMTRQFGGTGLGLAISKRLAQLLGGDVTVRSEPQVGSCFTFEVATGVIDSKTLDANDRVGRS